MRIGLNRSDVDDGGSVMPRVLQTNHPDLTCFDYVRSSQLNP